MPGNDRFAGEVPQWQHNEDRMRRADSWHRRGTEAESDEEKFIFLWIAFNAAYGGDTFFDEAGPRLTESDRFQIFLRDIVARDHGKALHSIIYEKFSGPIRVLLGNQYVYSGFWRWIQDPLHSRDWRERFNQSNKYVYKALEKDNVDGVLRVIFSRLYTLRNQIIHGGCTYASGWGRDQLRDGARIMEALVPAVLDVMRADIARDPATEIWGKVAYPRINFEPR